MVWGTTLYILEISKKTGISFTVFGVHPPQAGWKNLSTNAFVCQLTQLHVIITTEFLHMQVTAPHVWVQAEKDVIFCFTWNA